MRVAEWLIDQKVDVIVSREDLLGKGPTYVFRDAGVELWPTAAQDLAAAVGSLLTVRDMDTAAAITLPPNGSSVARAGGRTLAGVLASSASSTSIRPAE